jgi:uncharacterized protein (DUF427 family)
VVIEGNQYFPLDAVKKEFLKPSNHTTICPWKGTAHYLSCRSGRHEKRQRRMVLS